MNKLPDALEACLRGVDEGQGLDAVLGKYPKYAAELRPLLEAALLARAAGQLTVPAEARRRGRARLLAHAIQLHNLKTKTRARYIPAWPRLAIALGVLAVLVLTSTGLVSASSGALPGDQLYSVKRTWEDVQLFFIVPQPERDLLESRFEQQRLDEIGELLGQRRAAAIVFSGLVMQQQDGQWVVSGIPVSISASTGLPARPISEGEPVIITGLTGDSTVSAKGVQLQQPGSALPPLEPSGSQWEAHKSGMGQPTMGGQPATASQAHASYQFTGIIESMQAGAWRINGQSVYADQATVIGAVKVGSAVKFEGYYSTDGRFVVTTLAVELTPAQQRTNPGEGSAKGSGDSGGGSGDNGGATDNGGSGGD